MNRLDPCDLGDFRTFFDEVGRLSDVSDAGTPARRSMADGDDGPEPERRDAYLRRLEQMEKEGRIGPDGSWNPNP